MSLKDDELADFKINLDFSKVDAGLAKLKTQIVANENALTHVLRKSADATARSIGNVRTAISAGVGGFVGAASASAIGSVKNAFMTIPKMFWGAINDASEAQSVERKFKAVFQNLAPEAESFAKAFGKSLGRNSIDIMSYMSRFQDTLVPLGLSRGQSGKISQKMTRLASDLAASEGISEMETVDRLVSAIVGNHEAVRRFGIVMTETSLNAKLLEMGIKGGAHAATEQEKVLARLNIILAGTRDAQGMAGKAAGSFAQESAALSSAWRDLSRTVGDIFLPSMAEISRFMRQFVNDLTSGVGKTDAWAESLRNATRSVLSDIKPYANYVLNLFASIKSQIGKAGGMSQIVKDLAANADIIFESFTEKLKESVKTGIVEGMKLAYRASSWDAFTSGFGMLSTMAGAPITKEARGLLNNTPESKKFSKFSELFKGFSMPSFGGGDGSSLPPADYREEGIGGRGGFGKMAGALPMMFDVLSSLGQRFGNNFEMRTAGASMAGLGKRLLEGLTAEQNTPRAQFIGIQDLQKTFQEALFESEEKRDRVKIELMRRQIDAAADLGKKMEDSATEMAKRLSQFLGWGPAGSGRG